MNPLLARGRDRLETKFRFSSRACFSIPYSLGDAIDWKQGLFLLLILALRLPYSLGDAIDWKRATLRHCLLLHESPTR